MPLGSASLTVVVPVELDGPALLTVILYWPLPPAVKVPCAAFVTARSKLVVTGVGGVTIGPLPPPHVGHSFGFDNTTVFAPSVPDTPGATFTSSNNIMLPPAGIELAFVQVT